MRLKESCRQSESVLTVSVFASPGTPSSSTCPPVMRPMSSLSIICFWPTITCPACAKSASTKADSCWMRSFKRRISLAGWTDTGLWIYHRNNRKVRSFPPRPEGSEAQDQERRREAGQHRPSHQHGGGGGAPVAGVGGRRQVARAHVGRERSAEERQRGGPGVDPPAPAGPGGRRRLLRDGYGRRGRGRGAGADH